MRNVVIVAACRTPIGVIGGQFKTLTATDLSIPVMQNLIKRSGIDPAMIDDVIWGCNYQRTYKENILFRVLPFIETVHHPCLQFRWVTIRLKQEKLIVLWQAVPIA